MIRNCHDTIPRNITHTENLPHKRWSPTFSGSVQAADSHILRERWARLRRLSLRRGRRVRLSWLGGWKLRGRGSKKEGDADLRWVWEAHRSWFRRKRRHFGGEEGEEIGGSGAEELVGGLEGVVVGRVLGLSWWIHWRVLGDESDGFYVEICIL